MKPTKKIKMILLIALVAVIVITAAGIGIHHFQQQKALRAHYMDFNACSQELQILVDFLLAKYPDTEDRPTYLRVAGNDQMLLNPGEGYVDLPAPVSDAIQIIAQEGFVSEKTDWCMITFLDGRVQFDTMAGAYALVYSPAGAPTYLHEQTENFPVLVEQIEGDWYHVTRTE